jgi:hypothetical protein
MARNPFQGDDVDPFSAARDEEGDIKESKTRNLGKEIEEMQAAEAPKPAKKQTFAEAFKSAKDGSTFTWNGKQYKKEYAQPKAKAPDLSSVRGGARSTGVGGATAAQIRAAEPPDMSAYQPRRPGTTLSDTRFTENIDQQTGKGTRARFKPEAVERFRMEDAMRSYRPRREEFSPNYSKGGKVTASSRADGCAKRGKTKGKVY